MEKLTWFKFNISDWMMGKIMKCPEVTQARFLRLCCLYWNKECQLSLEDAEIEIDKEHLDILLSKKIIVINGADITIKFLDEQDSSISETSKLRREAVQKRWAKVKQSDTSVLKIDTSVLKIDTSVLQNDTEKSRVEKRREEEKREDDVKSKIPVTPSATFFTMADFEQNIRIGENQFSLMAVRKTNRSVNDLQKFLDVFITEQKALSHLVWKNETDAKQHFINWAAKQPKPQQSRFVM